MELNLNFASRRYVNHRAVSKAYWLISIGFLSLLIWAVMQCLVTHTQIRQSQGQLTTLQQDEQELLGTQSVPLDSQRVEELRSEFERKQNLLDQDSFRWTALFDRMELLLPSGVSIRRFQPDYGKQSLAIEGVAKDLSKLQSFLDRLLEADSIENAYLNRQAYTKVRDAKGNEQPALSFSVNLEGVF